MKLNIHFCGFPSIMGHCIGCIPRQKLHSFQDSLDLGKGSGLIIPAIALLDILSLWLGPLHSVHSFVIDFFNKLSSKCPA